MTNPAKLPTELDSRLAQAIAELVPDARSVELVGNRAHLVRVTDEQGEWRVHRWPDGTPSARVRFSRALSASLMPEPGNGDKGWALVDGALVDRQPWRPGESLPTGRERRLADGHALHVPGELDATAEQRLIRAVARAHLAAESLVVAGQAPIAPVDRVLRIVQTNWREARERLRPIAREHPPVQRWLRVGEQLLPEAEAVIAATAPSFLPPVVCHLNLWPGHAIRSPADGEVALIDFSAAAATTPLLDIARLIGGFNGWSGHAAERVLAGYAETRPLGPDERRALPAVAALDLVIEAARLLALGYGRGDEHASGVSQAARAGALHMLNSMDALHPAVVRATEPVSYAKRRRLERGRGRPPRRDHS